MIKGKFMNRNVFSKITLMIQLSKILRFKFSCFSRAYTTTSYNVVLDNKLNVKHYDGSILTTDSEPLAVLIANEWNMQEDTINRASMHFTNLLYLSTNPQNIDPDTLVKQLLAFLENDSLCYRDQEQPELYKEQKEKWNPIIDWFNQTYHVNISATSNLLQRVIDEKSLRGIENMLRSHLFATLVAAKFACEACKSVILTQALLENHLTAAQITDLCLLEQQFQVRKWGNVEWSHEFHKQDTLARLSSAYIFNYFSQERVSSQMML